jgi:putative phosphoribosyl transferase
MTKWSSSCAARTSSAPHWITNEEAAMNATLSQLVQIPADAGFLEGMLELPPNARGVVLFAHGSGSSRLSPRNNFVAEKLREGRVGTLLVDLLLEDEEAVYESRFDIPLLTRRLATVAAWIAESRAASDLPLGLFGASTGAAAALRLAAAERASVTAVVSRGGRPDLAGAMALQNVHAPTQLIVGAEDHEVIELNRSAYDILRCEKRIQLVPGATHLFEEPGTLARAALLARQWFERHLCADAAALAFVR